MSVFLGPWQWGEASGEPCWLLPAGCVGAVDLRTLAEQAQPGSTPGVGVFVSNAALPSEFVRLGDHPGDRPTGKTRAAWKSLTGHTPQGDTLAAYLWDHLTRGSDPDGGTAPKPLLPGKLGRSHWIDLHLGTYRKSEPFAWGEDAVATERVRTALRRDFRRIFAASQAGRFKDRKHHQRALDFWCQEYGVQDWREFVDRDLRADIPGREPHETTITDDFNRANAATLGANWTNDSGSMGIASNKLQTKTEGSDRASVSHNTSLSSADHYAQLEIDALNASTGLGLCVRRNGAADYYFGQVFYNSPATTQTQGLNKRIAGVFTSLPSTSAGWVGGDTGRLEISGSALTWKQNGTLVLSTTDTAITGNLVVGARGHATLGNNTADNFEAGDIASGILYTQLERGPRGVTRGVYTEF